VTPTVPCQRLAQDAIAMLANETTTSIPSPSDKVRAKRKGDGHFSQAPKLTNVKGDDLAETPGKDHSHIVYGQPDKPAVRGGRSDRDKTGR
jgi:hypothetical protein